MSFFNVDVDVDVGQDLNPSTSVKDASDARAVRAKDAEALENRTPII